MKRITANELSILLNKDNPIIENYLIESLDFSNKVVNKKIIINNCKLNLCRFINSQLSSIIIKDSVINYCEFIDTDMINIEFIKCKIMNSTFGRSKQKECDYELCTIENVYFTNLKKGKITFLRSSFVNKISFEGANLNNGLFICCNYKYNKTYSLNFMNTSLKGTKFEDCYNIEPEFCLHNGLESFIKRVLRKE